jgi:hypothetical protein
MRGRSRNAESQVPIRSRTDHRTNLIDSTDHLGPALGREKLELVLHHPEREKPKANFPDLPSMSIGAEAEITNNN